jgi:hypothetical protein
MHEVFHILYHILESWPWIGSWHSRHMRRADRERSRSATSFVHQRSVSRVNGSVNEIGAKIWERLHIHYVQKYSQRDASGWDLL